MSLRDVIGFGVAISVGFFSSATLLGCSLKGDFGGTNFQCPDGECPSGYSCEPLTPLGDEVCIEDGRSADAGADAPDAGPGALSCGEPGLTSTNFDEGLWSAYADESAGGTVTIADGELTITAPPAQGSFASYADSYHTKLIGNRMTVEVVRFSGGAEPLFQFWENDYLQVSVEGTNLVGRISANGTTTTGLVPYDPVMHRFWSLVERDGVVAVEVSPDETTWTTVHERRVVMADDFGHVELSVRSLGMPGFAVFDNLNGGGEQVSETCPFDLPIEGFENSVLGIGYSDYNSDCGRVVADGKLEWSLSTEAGAAPFCALIATYRVDLRNRTVGVEMSQFATIGMPNPEINHVLNLRGNGGEANLYVGGDSLIAEYCESGDCITLGSAVLDPVAHRFWRFRHDGSLHYEVSLDGSTWDSLGSIGSVSMNLGAVEVELILQAAVPASGAVVVEQFGPMP